MAQILLVNRIKALSITQRSLLIRYRALSIRYGALMIEYGALLQLDRVLLMKY